MPQFDKVLCWRSTERLLAKTRRAALEAVASAMGLRLAGNEEAKSIPDDSSDRRWL